MGNDVSLNSSELPRIPREMEFLENEVYQYECLFHKWVATLYLFHYVFPLTCFLEKQDRIMLHVSVKLLEIFPKITEIIHSMTATVMAKRIRWIRICWYYFNGTL